MRMTNEQFTLATLVVLTTAGNPATFDGPAVLVSSDETVVRVEGDKLIAVAPGVAQITATIDADLGDGVRTLEASGAIEVVAAEADTFELRFSDPQTA